jgi:hypothetical protein
MKITKQQLRQIIKEELRCTLLKEGFFETDPKRHAELLYRLLEGWTTSEEDETIKSIIHDEYYSLPQNMAQLYDSYWEVLQQNNDIGRGDLIDWLYDDYLSSLGFFVSSQLRRNEYGPRRGQE